MLLIWVYLTSDSFIKTGGVQKIVNSVHLMITGLVYIYEDALSRTKEILKTSLMEK